MPDNAFIGKAEAPSDAELKTALGPAAALWKRLVADVTEECGVDGREWNSYSRKAGWALRLKRGKRVILYLAPGHGGFTASLVLGAKAVEAAHRGGLPPEVVRIIDASRRYAEGTGVRLEVHGAEDSQAVRKLARIKVEN